MSLIKLDDLAEIRGRVGWKGYSVDDLRDEGPLVVGANDITGDNQLDLSNAKHLTREKYEESPEIFIEIYDILVVKVGSTIGKVCIIKDDIGEATINPNCVIVRSKGINPFYLYYYMCSPAGRAFLLNNSAASGQPALNQTNLKQMEIPIVNEAIQNNISCVLNNINRKISLNNSICADLEAMAKQIYDYWFVQFDFPNEDGKPYKSSGGKMVWNEELKREIPAGWEVTTVDNIVINHDSKRVPLSTKERENKVGIIPYYGATSVMGYVDEPIFNGDYVLLAEDGSVMTDKGFPIIQRITGKTWVNNHAHVLEPARGYHCKLLMFVLGYIPVKKIKTGSIQMKIPQENLNTYQIVDIPKMLIDKVNPQLDKLEEKILCLQAENRELTELRDFLLPMLMNGQISFKDGE